MNLASFLLVSTVFAMIFEKPAQRQIMYGPYEGPVSTKSFMPHVAATLEKHNPNAAIPPASPDQLRVMSYNIHHHLDITGTPNYPRLDKELGEIDADVIFFQEVYTNAWRPGNWFAKILEKHGYKYLTVAQHSKQYENLENIIASRVELHGDFSCDLPEPYGWDRDLKQLVPGRGFIKGRALAHSTIMLADGVTRLHLLNTHLSVGWTDENRVAQASYILNRVINEADHMYLLGGDFNDHAGSASLKMFTASDLGRDVFNDLRWDSPKYTCWAGTTIDFLLAGRKLHGKVAGAYVYYTSTSDHFPVIADLAVTPMRR